VDEHGAAQVLTVQSDAGRDVQPEVLQALGGIRLGRVTVREPTLEDAYVAIVSEPAEVPVLEEAAA
jgi:ABC-2 type transport system ATP-binding protein